MKKNIIQTILLGCIAIFFASCGKTETSVITGNNVSKEIPSNVTYRYSPVQTLSELDEEVYTVQTLSDKKRSFQDYHVLGVTPPVK